LQGGIILEVVLILLLIGINGLFAGSELAMVSSSKARLKKLALGGSTRAAAALKLSKSPNTFLSTVQIGITLVGIFAGAFGGATLSGKLAVVISSVDILAPYSETLSFVLVVMAITYLSLVVGELVPKRLAMNNPEGLALFAAKPMSILSVITKPFIWLLSTSTEVVLKLLRFKASTKSEVSAEEIKILVDEGTRSGTIDEVEKDIIGRVFKAGELEITSIMTIRQDMIFLDKDDENEVTIKTLMQTPYSRYPVIEGNFDNVIGYVNSKEILKDLAKNGSIDIMKHLMPVVKTPEDTPVLHMLDIFKEKETHIAIVSNEYGGTEGLITLGEVMDSIVGDIEKEESKEITMLNDNEYHLSGSLHTEDLKELLKISSLPNEEEDYKTVAGLLMTNLEAVPKVNDVFEWERYKFKVIEMKGNRVMKVRLTIMDKPGDTL